VARVGVQAAAEEAAGLNSPKQWKFLDSRVKPRGQ
jgi:hypothetical protein